jgi:hypothetical protein
MKASLKVRPTRDSRENSEDEGDFVAEGSALQVDTQQVNTKIAASMFFDYDWDELRKRSSVKTLLANDSKFTEQPESESEENLEVISH